MRFAQHLGTDRVGRGATSLNAGNSKMTNSDTFDWNDLRYFLAVVRHGSTLAAAKAMHTSQSTVHRRLRELEQRLGHSLVRRHPTGYRLTELGSLVVSHAERVEAAVLSFERHLAAVDERPAGVVRVTCPEALGARLMRSRLIEKFNSRYPALRVELLINNKQLDLAKGEADIAIRRGAPSDGSLFGRKIAESQWGVYATRSYVSRHGCIERFADIDSHRVIMLDGFIRDHDAARWLRSVAPNANIVARGDSLQTLLLAVKSGIGISPLPLAVGENERDLERLLDPIPGVVTDFYLLMHEDMRRTPRVRAFFDFIVDELKLVRSVLGGDP
jgi:DNA-binding transcriptional LysR family regulator